MGRAGFVYSWSLSRIFFCISFTCILRRGGARAVPNGFFVADQAKYTSVTLAVSPSWVKDNLKEYQTRDSPCAPVAHMIDV